LNRGVVLLKAAPALPGGWAARPGRWLMIGGEASEGYSEQFGACPVAVVNHNLGRQPCSCCVRTLGGVIVDAHVQHVSENQTRVYFDVPTPCVVEVS
jgi:uncharacterized membrane protein